MPLKVIIVCHVEPGRIQGRSIRYDFGLVDGIAQALPEILGFADSLALPLGLALTPQACKIANGDFGRHDVGVHLHPQDPEVRSRLAGRLDLSHDCLGRYTPQDQALLISTAVRVFEDALGRSPRLFVAGRWSEDQVTPRLLQAAGFTHDASVLPGHRSSCADWSHIPRLAQPYSADAGGDSQPGSRDLVCLPVYQGLWGNHLTPETIHNLGISYFKAALQEAQVGGADMVHIYFHSPLALNSEALDDLGALVTFARDSLGAVFVRPTDLAASTRSRSRPFPPAYLARLDWTMLRSLAWRGRLGERLAGNSSQDPESSGVTSSHQDDIPPR